MTDGYSNIYADNLSLVADGDIGSEQSRMSVYANNFTSRSRNIYLHSNSPTLKVKDITAVGIADVTADGNLIGGTVQADSVKLEAYGNIGESSRNPFVVNTPVVAGAKSLYGFVYLRNPFIDVSKSDWFYYEVMWMYAMGIV